MTNDEGMTKHKSSTLAPARAHNPSRGMGPRSEVGERRTEDSDQTSEVLLKKLKTETLKS
jgi:hypothetical protein